MTRNTAFLWIQQQYWSLVVLVKMELSISTSLIQPSDQNALDIYSVY